VPSAEPSVQPSGQPSAVEPVRGAQAAPAVRVEGLAVRFGDVEAVRGLDLTVPAGGSVALVGRNGAGKSTTLRVLAGVVPATDGVIRIGDIDVRRRPQAAKALVGYCPDVGGLVPRATPWEHLQLAAKLRGLAGWEARGRDLLERFDLAAVADRVTAGFSHGMGRRLSVVLAAFHAPRVLLLDEPFDGVDPLGVDATLALVADERDAGSAVLVSTHLVALAAAACETAVVLRGGEVAGTVPSGALTGPQGDQRYRRMLA
jgi:ABC-2 type transport system ATP-binding protein